MKIRESIQADIEYMKDHSISRGILSKQPECIDYCYTLEHEDKVLCIGGFRLINLTTMWVWLDMSPEADGHIITVYRTIKEYLDIFAAEMNIKRAQAYVEEDFEEAVRMVNHLGFEWESDMKNFIGNKTALLFRRLF